MSTNYISQITASNGTTYDIQEGVTTRIFRATCSTAAATAAKVATLDDATGYSLTAGVRVAVTFTYGNSATSPTLNVNSGGAKNIYYRTAITTAQKVDELCVWGANETVIFTYDGSSWLMMGSSLALYNAYNRAASSGSGTITEVKTNEGAHTTIDVLSGKAEFNVPTKTSHLTNDSGFLTAAVTSISTAAGIHTPQTQAVTGNVSFNIPTKTSHLVNDSGFITTDTNTWRAIQVNGTQILAGTTGTNALNLKAGTNVSLSNSSGTVTITSTDTNTASATANILDGSNSGTAITYAPYSAQQSKLSFDTSTTAPTRTDRLNLNGHLYSTTISPIKAAHGFFSAASYGGTGNTTKIKININSTTSWMLSFVVNLYQGYRATKVMISGYQYGNSHWYEPEAVLIADSNGTETISVYFGYDSTNNLWVGFDGGNYTGVTVTDVVNGYTQITDYSNLFTISNVSSLGGTTQTTVTADSKANYANSAGAVPWSGVSSKPTATQSKVTGITASTTATKTTLGTAFTIPNVTSAGSASTWAFEEVSIPNVTAAGSASTWTFGATTVGDGTLVGAVDSSDTSMLVITAGTKSVQQKTGGANGTAPTIGTAIKVQSKKSGANGSAPTLGTAFTVPNVTGNTSATVSITDNGHTHTI